jgi:hypothetical protein
MFIYIHICSVTVITPLLRYMLKAVIFVKGLFLFLYWRVLNIVVFMNIPLKIDLLKRQEMTKSTISVLVTNNITEKIFQWSPLFHYLGNIYLNNALLENNVTILILMLPEWEIWSIIKLPSKWACRYDDMENDSFNRGPFGKTNDWTDPNDYSKDKLTYPSLFCSTTWCSGFQWLETTMCSSRTM